MIRVIIHERSSLWTAELERRLSGQTDLSFRWHPYRSDLLQNALNAEIMVLVVSPDDDSLDLIRELRRCNQSARLICLVETDALDWENLARELGVTGILPDVAMKSDVAELVMALCHALTAGSSPSRSA